MNKKHIDVEWFVDEQEDQTRCAICNCIAQLTLHHLIPQVECKNKYRKMKDDVSNHIMICRQCHDQIHALFSENQLRDEFNTIDKLLSNSEFKKFVEWKKKHPDFNGHSKMSNNRKHR